MAGGIVHIEFPAENADRATKFWNGLFGWSFQDSGMEGMDYRMAQAGEQTGAAVYPSEDRSGYPNYYFATDDIDASSDKVRELGGQAEAKAPVPGHGWFAACKDSEGNAFHLWQQDSSAA
jgi:predicted enzyme related to lactoylglutathione lyase